MFESVGFRRQGTNHTDKKKKSTARVLFLFGRSVEKHRNKLLVTLPAPQISKLFSAWSLGALHFRRRRKVKYELHTDNKREHTENGMLSFMVAMKQSNSNFSKKSRKPLYCKGFSVFDLAFYYAKSENYIEIFFNKTAC